MKASLLDQLHKTAFMLERKTGNDYPSVFHSHLGYELVHVLEGEAFIILEDQAIPVEKDSLLIFQGLTIHKVMNRRKEPYKRNIVHFLPQFVPDWDGEEVSSVMGKLDAEIAPYLHIRLTGAEAEKCARIFEAMHEEQEEPQQWGWRRALQLHLLQLLLLFCRQSMTAGAEEEVQRQSTRSSVQLSEVMGLLNRMWKSPCTLDDIAEALHMSKYYLCHYFKREVGVSIQQYLMQRRVNEAKRLLLQTNLSVKEVGFAIGFQTASHFGKKFKEELGLTPEQFRNQSRAR